MCFLLSPFVICYVAAVTLFQSREEKEDEGGAQAKTSKPFYGRGGIGKAMGMGR